MMDLSREEVTIMSELSIGAAMAVTQSVWARMVPRRTSCSCDMIGLLCAVCVRLQKVGVFEEGRRGGGVGNKKPYLLLDKIYTNRNLGF